MKNFTEVSEFEMQNVNGGVAWWFYVICGIAFTIGIIAGAGQK